MRNYVVIICVVIFLSIGVNSCNSSTKVSIKNQDEKFTFLYYADTRADPRFNNWNQVLHKKFIDKILENEKDSKINHLVFGGDNVLIGFFKPSWNLFFKLMNTFVKKGINIYPAIGNHELWLSRVGYAAIKLNRQYNSEYKNQKSDIYNDWVAIRDNKKRFEEFMMVKNLKEGLLIKLDNIIKDSSFEDEHQKFLQQLETEFGDIPSKLFLEIAEIYHIAQEISLLSTSDLGFDCKESLNWKRFNRYVGTWPHLENKDEIDKIKNCKTYYSFKLPNRHDPKVKIIILDSNKNMIDNEQQKNWFLEELKKPFDGPVIVACHHPIFFDEGWFKEEISSDWKTPPHLVLTGHYHDYERISRRKKEKEAPVYIISGSGGARLEKGKAHCIDDDRGIKPQVFEKMYNYTRITIAGENIEVKVYGCKKMKNKLELIDKIDFKWKK